MSMRNSEGILLSALNPKYLHSNSTSHTWPFSAIAELIDNAYDPDVMAKQFWIDWSWIKGFDCLTFQDNGKGMTKEGMHKMLSFGFSDKQAVKGRAPVGLYGNGFKSSSMRLGKDAIVFSKTRETMNVGLLSQSYLESIQAEHVVVPIITIGQDGQCPAEDAASLQDILKHSPFNTVEDLLTELRAITSISSTGTRIIIWNLRRVGNGETEFDLSTDKYDIRIPADACETHKNRNGTQSVPVIIYSLCAYCSFLYLKPRMQIIIRGQKVKTELISKSLALTCRDQYTPSFLKERIPITFGYTINKDEYGMMMYHKNRLIKAFERVGCQRKGGPRGVGVIGIIECNFLQPTHNKQDFDDTDEYRKTMNNLAVKLDEYWDEIQYKRKGCLQRTEDTEKCPDQIWVQCDDCLRWRKLPDGINRDLLPDKWFCHLNPHPQYRSCQVEEEPEDSEDEQQCYPKPYKRLKKMSKMQEKKDQQQTSIPALPLPATPLSGSEQWRPAEGALTGRSSESFTHPSCSGQNLPCNTLLMDYEDYVSTSPESPQTSAPALPLPATRGKRRRPADHVSTSPERVKQVHPHTVGVSSNDTETRETCENGGAGNGPQSPMLEVQQQPDGLLDTYKEQVNQLQQELEEMKHKCEHLQVMETEFQKRMEDMVMENSSLSYQCEQLNRELEQLRTNGGTGMPSPGEEAQNNVNISSQEDTCRKLRNLRQRIGRLLVTIVPTLDLEEINLDSDVMDKILDEVLNEVTEV